jgi:enoyl-CoA hydratase
MQVDLADGVTTVRIDHPPVNAFDLGLVDDAVALVLTAFLERLK